MVPKRATFMTYGNDNRCSDLRKSIEDAGVLLTVRDIEKEPLTVRELEDLIGCISLSHFLNTLSDSYTKYKLEKTLLPRDEIFKLMSKDHTLIRRPIVRTVRLITVGCDVRKVAEMLQVSLDSNAAHQEGADNGNKRQSPRGKESTSAPGK